MEFFKIWGGDVNTIIEKKINFSKKYTSFRNHKIINSLQNFPSFWPKGREEGGQLDYGNVHDFF